MRIPARLGLQKTSLVDYPGKIAPVIFFPGCNLRCPYCHNPDLVYGRSGGLLPWEEVFSYVKFRAPLLGGVVLSGGEPLLYPGTPDFVKRIKEETGLKVKVDSNGLNPGALARLEADYIALDFKAPLPLYGKLGAPEDAAEAFVRSLALLQERGIDYEIRTTLLERLLPLEDVPEMGRLLRGVPRHYLTGFKPGNCLDREYDDLPEVSSETLLRYRDAFRAAGCPTEIRSL